MMKLFGFVVVVMLFVFGLFFVAGGLNILSQPGRVLQRTLDADNMIYNYEWFKQQHADVLAIDRQIINTQNTLLDTRNVDEQTRLRSIIMGLQNKRASMVETYNARARMANRALFMTDSPPALN